MIISIQLGAYTYPTTPKNPKEPTIKGSNATKRSFPKTKKKFVKKEHVKIQVELTSGDRIKGLIQVPLTFSFVHYKNGLKYNKTLNFKQIKTITINSYRVKNSVKKKLHVFYEFVPQYVTVTMKNKRSYTLSYLFQFLNSFQINTEDGITHLYSFFADTWENKTGWKEVHSKNKKYHYKNAHPQSVKKITVLYVGKSGADL